MEMIVLAAVGVLAVLAIVAVLKRNFTGISN
jgi:hypothetical protein